ncbi:MAG: hypothetical protein V4578_25790, partial [Pseudomonadota bacterium]
HEPVALDFMSFSGKSFHVDFLNELHTLIWWFRHCFSGLGLFVNSFLSERKAGNYNRQTRTGSSAMRLCGPCRGGPPRPLAESITIQASFFYRRMAWNAK